MRKILLGLVAAICAVPVNAHDVTVDTSAARAVTAALANPSLTREEALRIAAMPANQMVIRKVRNQDDTADSARFADELVAVAHGDAPQGKWLFRFDRTKRDIVGIVNTLNTIDGDRAGFVRRVNDRVEMFSPPGKPLALKGSLVGGGSSTGFAFGGNDFYLNISHFPDDPVAAYAVMSHELFHAVQATAAKALGDKAPPEFDEQRLASLSGEARNAYVVDAYFNNLMTEGIAMYVGDPLLEKDSKGGYSKWDLDRLHKSQENMDRWVIMLDTALIALTAPQPIDYQDAYALGFYGADQPLYFLGYEMAKAITEAKGPKRLGVLSIGSGCGFAREYLAVSAGKKDLPKLSERTQAMIGTYCKA